MKVVIASNNAGKIREYKELFSGMGHEVLSLKDAGIDCDPEETGQTFEENAAIKARAVHKLCGCAALADDSGLAVDALNGEPGVYSARWLGLDTQGKNLEVLRRLEGKQGEERKARFICAICFIYPDGREITAKGVCEGVIGESARGTEGFGYDPIFMYGDKSFAELAPEVKNAVSHRGQALKDLLAKLV